MQKHTRKWILLSSPPPWFNFLWSNFSYWKKYNTPNIINILSLFSLALQYFLLSSQSLETQARPVEHTLTGSPWRCLPHGSMFLRTQSWGHSAYRYILSIHVLYSHSPVFLLPTDIYLNFFKFCRHLLIMWGILLFTRGLVRFLTNQSMKNVHYTGTVGI